MSHVDAARGLVAVWAAVWAAGACNSDGTDGEPDGAGDGAGLCDAVALAGALAAAASGDVVRVGACRIEGSFTVPAGVTLAGAGTDASTLVAVGESPAVRLEPGTAAPRVADLAVESAGNSGIVGRGRGAGSVTLERLRVATTRGMAVGLENLASAAVSQVTLEGPVTAENAADTSMHDTPEETASHGLVLVRVADAVLTDVAASGFARFGVLAVDSATTWTGGAVRRSLGAGAMIHGGTATLGDVALSEMYQGVRLLPTYGIVVAGGAAVDAARLTISRNEGYGLLADGSDVRLVDLAADANRNAAVWAQQCPSLELVGTGMLLAANRFAGIVVVAGGDVTIADGRIERTELATRIFRETGAIQVGDGIQIRGWSGCLTLRDLTLADNGRAGIVIESDEAAWDCVTIENVTVDGAGDAYGALAQGSAVPSGWDGGVTRLGVTAINDAARTDPIVVVSLESDAVPPVDAIVADGLAGIIDPDP